MWDLDHDDVDRSKYRGAAHSSCNRAAGAKKGNGNGSKPRMTRSRDW
jgi:hypothetical protein